MRRLPLDGETRDPVGAVCLRSGPIAKEINVAVGPIAQMEREAINQAIAHREKGFRVIGVQGIAQLQNSRRPVRLPALLNNEQPVCARFGCYKDRLVPFDAGERLFDSERQRRIRRPDQPRGGPRDSVLETERTILGGPAALDPRQCERYEEQCSNEQAWVSSGSFHHRSTVLSINESDLWRNRKTGLRQENLVAGPG